MQPLSEIITYRTLHALCSVNKRNKMTVVFYVSCLVYGRNPVWGIWNRNRKFLRFAGGKEAIGRDHPGLAWRRIMTPWRLDGDHDVPAAARREILAAQFESPLPKPVERLKPGDVVEIQIPVFH